MRHDLVEFVGLDCPSSKTKANQTYQLGDQSWLCNGYGICRICFRTDDLPDALTANAIYRQPEESYKQSNLGQALQFRPLHCLCTGLAYSYATVAIKGMSGQFSLVSSC